LVWSPSVLLSRSRWISSKKEKNQSAALGPTVARRPKTSKLAKLFELTFSCAFTLQWCVQRDEMVQKKRITMKSLIHHVSPDGQQKMAET
jgi:hypothetical protein